MDLLISHFPKEADAVQLKTNRREPFRESNSKLPMSLRFANFGIDRVDDGLNSDHLDNFLDIKGNREGFFDTRHQPHMGGRVPSFDIFWTGSRLHLISRYLELFGREVSHTLSSIGHIYFLSIS